MKKLIYLSVLVCLVSCIEDGDRYRPNEGEEDGEKKPFWVYPYVTERTSNITAEITITTDGSMDLNTVNVEIPPLKYNKTMLFMMTQDDCVPAAYSCTWAAINGKPLIHVTGNEYFYGAAHLRGNDLPPGYYSLGKTLGTTDGAGNEVRFAPTTTLAPEEEFMDREMHVDKSYKKNYYRFYKQSGLVWDDATELTNYGWGIAFHDMDVPDASVVPDLLKHYAIAQDIIKKKMNGRGCKTLAEPNGNKAYITAANQYDDIKIITAQTGVVDLYPHQVIDGLNKALLQRHFYGAKDAMDYMDREYAKPVEDRRCFHLGVHSTAGNNGVEEWTDFLVWLNDTYGKDGNDAMWFPSLEEYYEYNYNRIHGSITKQVSGNQLKITVNLPGGNHFYFPSTTINIKGLDKGKITSIESNNIVTGMSVGNHGDDATMVNIDCRRYLSELANEYVERYENMTSDSGQKEDALYFISRLKESDVKTNLLNKVK